MAVVGVIGAGAWGTALAIAAARAGNEVRLWGRDRDRIANLGSSRENARYLPGIAIPESVRPTAEPGDLVEAGTLLLAVPAQQVRAVCRDLPAGGAPLVVCAKGLERATGLRLSQVVAAERPGTPVAALSGPSFALEVGRGLPTAVTIAAEDKALATVLAERLASPCFRPYPSDDLLGVELAGALKNVVAIAAGMAQGLGAGDNTRAAVITRGLAELSRLGAAMGGNPLTFSGLAGLGDLVATCSSPLSRNRHVGDQLGRGRSIDVVLAELRSVAEGVPAAPVTVALAAEHGVEVPIAVQVADVLAGRTTAADAYRNLLGRRRREELYGLD
jgi:glycerol-3-phosphate dehydrogenase (NAD(P)+)